MTVTKRLSLQLPFLLVLFVPVTAVCQKASIVARNTLPSVVMLQAQDSEGRPISQGSGFFVRPNVVATNYHVIKDGAAALVKIIGDANLYPVEGIVALDETSDLALLKIKSPSRKPLILADNSRLEVGQEIFALGNPKGLEGTISQGIISSKTLRQLGREKLIQITAPISPGSSGGPIVNIKGEVVGITVSTLTAGQNLNFAIPSALLSLLLADSGNIMTFSEAFQREPTIPSVRAEPSIQETTAWLVDKLSIRTQRLSQDGPIVKNDYVGFDQCKMTYRVSTIGDAYKQFDTYVAQLERLTHVGGDKNGQSITLYFQSDSVYLHIDDDLRAKKVDYRVSNFSIRIGDIDLERRVEKAFISLKKTCTINSEKEPF